jgi:hypothetical protein
MAKEEKAKEPTIAQELAAEVVEETEAPVAKAKPQLHELIAASRKAYAHAKAEKEKESKK